MPSKACLVIIFFISSVTAEIPCKFITEYLKIPEVYRVPSSQKAWWLVPWKMTWIDAMRSCSWREMELISLKSENGHRQLKEYFLNSNPKVNWHIWTSEIDETCKYNYELSLRERSTDGSLSVPECKGTCEEVRVTRLEDGGEAQIKSYNIPCYLQKWTICEFNIPKECEGDYSPDDGNAYSTTNY